MKRREVLDAMTVGAAVPQPYASVKSAPFLGPARGLAGGCASGTRVPTGTPSLALGRS